MTTYSTLKSGGPLKRGKGLNYRSKKSRAKDEARVATREEVLERDQNCVFHLIVANLGGRSICDGWGGRLQVHEVKTRARRGSITDPDNCVAVCNWANTSWLTTHDAGAETLGLLLPGWASGADARWSYERRLALLADVATDLTIPPWRSDVTESYESNYIARVIRDLNTLGIRSMGLLPNQAS